MQYTFLSFLLSFTIFYSLLEAKATMITAKNFSELHEVVSKVDQETLVIFDVDEILITTADSILHPKVNYLRNEIIYDVIVEKGVTTEERDEAFSIFFTNKVHRPLLDKETPEMISKLQDRGVSVMGLTAFPTGKLGQVESIEDWRAKHLQGYGIDFRKTSPCEGEFSFPRLAACLIETQDKVPVYHEGILFSGSASKGPTLRAFLDKVGYRPKSLLFVDDRPYNLESVRNTASELGIDATLVHYTAYIEPETPHDMEVARFQFNHLFEAGEWLADGDARECLFQ